MAPEPREDLAAMLTWAARRLGEAEEPLLAACGLTMWEYIILSRLAREPVPNQLTLARDIRHDKTRLITLLDGLQERGLIDRSPDPADRRSHRVLLTRGGAKLHEKAQTAIRDMENNALQPLTRSEQLNLLSALPKLYAEEGPSTARS